MKKNKIKLAILILCLFILGLSACSSNKKNIIGKYINVFDESHYIIFSEDDSFIDNFLTTTNKENSSISDCYIYRIDDKGLITIIDTTEYEGQNSLNEYEFGWIYENYVGSLWSGDLPTKNIDTKITCILNNIIFEYQFNKDNTYEYTATSNGEKVNTEYGTYSINGNEVICTSEEDVATTFFNTDNGVFCVEYIKE